MRGETRVRAVLSLPKRARGTWAALNATLTEQQQEQLAELLKGAYQFRGKAESDHRTDHERRVLIGARVPRSLAARCRSAAERGGISVYRWVIQAIENQLRTEDPDRPSGDPPGSCGSGSILRGSCGS
jgi:predicted HicB family RNase H-like nuclease